MRTAALRYCLSGSILFAIPTLTHASLDFSVKTESADLFRTQAVEPPPVTTLSHGDILQMIKRGEASSLVQSEGGVKGWMRNEDVLAMESASGQKVKLGEQAVVGGGEAVIGPYIFHGADFAPDVVSLERTFNGEIIQNLDKEQVEMKNGDN